MNNSRIINEEISEQIDTNPILREQATQLTTIIEAIQQIGGSKYWQVLKQFVFDVDLRKAKSRLAGEKDTTEIFRLQGEIRWGNKFDLDRLLTSKRNELEVIRKKINGK